MTNSTLTIPASASSASVAALAQFATDFIGYGAGLGSYFGAANADPTAPLIQAYAGALHMALEAATGYEAAQPFLSRAMVHAGSGSDAEQRVTAAILDWSRGRADMAVRGLMAHVTQTPEDLLAAKWGQYLAFNLGDAGAMLKFAELTLPRHREVGAAHGMLAFGLEQTHELEAAEAAGRRALAIDRADAWAQHAVAHVLETQGRVDEGIGFLRDHSDTWSDRSVFMREHNWWHVALFHLDREEPQEALKIFDAHLWGEWQEFGQEQIGAVSMLWRLELRGVDVGARWVPIGQKIAARGPEHVWPFHDMHFVYGLARAGQRDALKTLMESMTRKAQTSDVWRDVAYPLAQGLVAHAEGRMTESATLIARAMPRLQSIGGSHAQRDVIVQTWMDAAIRAGEHSAARAVLEERLEARPNIPVTTRLLGMCGAPRLAFG